MTKGMILSAGLGTRMRHLTQNCPKPLIKIAGTTLIEHNIAMMKKAGITDIVINLGYLGHMIKDALQEGTDLGVRIQYTQEEAHTLLGSGGGVKNALHLLGDQPFFLASSDIWSTMCLRAFIESANRPRHTALLLVENPVYHPKGDVFIDKYGVVHAPSKANNATFSGMGMFCPSYFSEVNETTFGLSEVIQKSSSENSCTGQFVDGLYENVGTPELVESLTQKIEASLA